jgi:steroid 5-alpha reductase family enzyme
VTMLNFAFPFDGVALAITLGITLFAFSIVWVASLKLNDAGIVDYYWGLGFPVIGWVTLWLAGAARWPVLLLLVAVTLWAIRLTSHMVARHIRSGVEDPRYAAMRAKGGPNFKMRSLVTVFLLQGFLMWLIAAPLHALVMASSEAGWLFWLGMKIFAIGFIIETVADWQLMRFRNDPRNKGQVLAEGLFAWSRHPNYFGELLLWWGLAASAFALTGSPYVLVGPALLSLIMIKVSGPPLLADHMKDRPGYAQWAERTPPLLPRMPSRRTARITPAE